jgi:small subunit ribosomal protein S2
MLGLCRTLASRTNNIAALQQQTLRLLVTDTSPSALKDSATRSDLNPLAVHDYFGVHKLFTVKDLFDARVHMGHKASALDSRMGQFMFGTRFGTSIIDLDQTTLLLRQALNFTAHIAYRNAGLFLSPYCLDSVPGTNFCVY